MRMTKIVCTMGPACDDIDTLVKMIDAGMNVARFNMSHGEYDAMTARFDRVKEAIKRSGKTVALLLDTKGPEIRVATFEGGYTELVEGQEFKLYAEPGKGDNEGVSLSYPKLIDAFMKDSGSVGRTILMDDGLIAVEVTGVRPECIVTKVLKGGKLSNRKSINIPGYTINMPYISAVDRADIEFGLKQGVNVIAASFVRSADDVIKLRDYIDSLGYEEVEIISKIENQSGVDDIDRIIEVSNGVMVARGDMGVEIPFINLPQIQKMIIRKCVLAGKYVITATQMLDSMTTNIRPTRAEISDVANAVYDGTSAVMLSGESAAGMYPVESVKALRDICTAAERNEDLMLLRGASATQTDMSGFRENICEAAKTVAENVNAKAIITVTISGFTANRLSRYKPTCPVIACTISETVACQMNILFDVYPLNIPQEDREEMLFDAAIDAAKKAGYVQKGDNIVLTAGVPLGVAGNTNMTRVIEVW